MEGWRREVFQVTDVSKTEDAEALVERAVSDFGRLDLANAGGWDGVQVPLHENPPRSIAYAFVVPRAGTR